MDFHQQEKILLSLNLQGLRQIKPKAWLFDCPNGCGKEKAGFYWKNGKLIAHCFKCGMSEDFDFFLYKRYRDEFVRNRVSTYGVKRKREVESAATTFVKCAAHQEFVTEVLGDGTLIPAIEAPETLGYLTKRQVPMERVREMYHCTNFLGLWDRLEKTKGTKPMDSQPPTRPDPRVVWLFRNRTDDIVGFQGRTLVRDREPRYLLAKLKEDDPFIGGLERVDLSRKIYATEGYVDSLFLDNAVSLQGMNTHQFEYLLNLGAKEIVIVLDNEPDNANLQKRVHDIAELSVREKRIAVALLPPGWRRIGKDINDYVLAGKTSEDLINTIDANTYRGATLEAARVRWSNTTI
jgi:hypothetical protein